MKVVGSVEWSPSKTWGKAPRISTISDYCRVFFFQHWHANALVRYTIFIFYIYFSVSSDTNEEKLVRDEPILKKDPDLPEWLEVI